MSINIDMELVQEVAKLTGCASEEMAITHVLQDFVNRRRRLPLSPANPRAIFELFGTVDFDPAYDYKEARRRDLKDIPEDDDC